MRSTGSGGSSNGEGAASVASLWLDVSVGARLVGICYGSSQWISGCEYILKSGDGVIVYKRLKPFFLSYCIVFSPSPSFRAVKNTMPDCFILRAGNSLLTGHKLMSSNEIRTLSSKMNMLHLLVKFAFFVHSTHIILCVSCQSFDYTSDCMVLHH